MQFAHSYILYLFKKENLKVTKNKYVCIMEY